MQRRIYQPRPDGRGSECCGTVVRLTGTAWKAVPQNSTVHTFEGSYGACVSHLLAPGGQRP